MRTKLSAVFCFTNQMWQENVDVVGHKPVRNNVGEMSVSQVAKQKAWLEHYEMLLNVNLIGTLSTCMLMLGATSMLMGATARSLK